MACEFSGVVREAFAARGHFACSVDLLPSELPGIHFQDDVRNYLDAGWDLLIAFPPCTYLTVTGNKWFKPEFASRWPNRAQDREDAADFFTSLINAPVPMVAVENPVGVMSTRYRKPDQIIQPYQFGHPERKSTCLWLRGLPKLVPADVVEPNIIQYKTRGGTDGAWHISTTHLPSPARMKARSRTFEGVARAMAEQWG